MDKERKDKDLEIFKKFVTKKATYAYGVSESGNTFIHGVYDDNGFAVFGTEFKDTNEVQTFTKVNKCKIHELDQEEFFFDFRYNERAFAFFRNFIMTKNYIFPLPIDTPSLLRLAKITSKNHIQKSKQKIISLNLNTKNGKAYTFFDPKKVKKLLQPLSITEENGVGEMIGSSYFCPTIDTLDDPVFYPCLFRRIRNKKTNTQIYILLAPFVPEGRYKHEFKVNV